MKNCTLTLLILLNVAVLPKLFSQNVGINSTGSAPDASAMLDVSSTSKGFLLPRMTTGQRDAITLPATGLSIFNTTLVSYQVNIGTPASPDWTSLTTTSNGWLLNGNSVASAQNIGTTSNFDLPFITNSTEKMRLTTAGYLGIGLSPTAVLHLKAGTASANTAPLKFTSGSLMTTAEAGAVEFLTNKFYGTITTGAARKEFTLNDEPLTSGRIPIVTTNGRLTDSSILTYDPFFKLGIRQTSPTAYLHIGSGTATSNTAPLKFTAGTLLTTPETGAVEYNGTHFYASVGGTRYQLDQQASLFSSTAPITYSNGLIGITQATTSTDGYLSSTDWNTFNNKATTTGSWSTTGNSGTTSATNFIGTTDNQNFKIKANAIQGLLVDSLGNVAVGTAPAFASGTAREKFLVDAGTTTSINAISAKGTIDSYFQMNIQNKSATAGASSDIVATSDNGDESYGFVDLGINSSAYNAAAYNIGGFNDSYLYSMATAGGIGGNFAIGTGSANKVLKFHTGGTTTANERMRIDGSGYVGIGNTSPTQKLDVSGNIKFSGALMPNNLPGSSGDVLTSAGAGAPPTWTSTSSSWNLQGTNAGNGRAIGISNNWGFGFVTNGTERMFLSAGGNLAIGATPTDTTNAEKLLVDGGTSTYNIIGGKANTNRFIQLNMKNYSSGNAASTDIVATNDAGTEANAINFIDMGINSSGYSTAASSILNGVSNAYLYSTGNDLIIGNATASKNLLLFTGGTAQSDERMRIDGSGNVGIANTSPTQKLDVTGNIRFSGALMPNNLAGTSGYFLTSAGAGSVPTWTAPGNQTISFAPTGDVTGSTTGTSTLAPALTIGALKVTNSMLAGSIAASKLIGTDISTVGTITAGTWSGTAIGVTKGGTGLTLTTQGDILYADAANSIAKLPKSTSSTRYLSNTGTSNNPAWAQIDLTTGVTGNLPVTNLNSGTSASSSTFWRGDGTWAAANTWSITSQTGSSYTATATDYTIICNNSAPMTVNLPTAVGITGRIYIIKKISGIALDVTIDAQGSQTIDGATTRVITNQYDVVRIQSNGSDWYVL